MKPIAAIELPSGSWADTVLVAFDTQEPVGTLHRLDGMGEERAIHAVFGSHPAIVLKSLLTPRPVGASGPLQVLKVNRLRVDEVWPRTLCLLHAEVLERNGDVHVRRYESSVAVEGERCGKRTDCHEENIVKAVQEFLDGYEKAVSMTGMAEALVPRSELSTAFRIDPRNTPVLGSTSLRRGLYRNFMQFRANAPDTLYDFEVKETLMSPGDGSVIRLKNMPGDAAEQYWGLCDGQHAYVRIGRSFIRLRRSSDGYTASVPQPDAQDPGAIVLGGLFFGAVGGAIAGAASNTPNPPIPCDLNMLCGDLAPHDRDLTRKDYAMSIFHVSRFAKSEAIVSVTCTGKPAVELTRKQWTGFQLPPQASALNVVIVGPKNSLTVAMNTNSDKLHVHLIDIKKDGTITSNELSEQMRIAIMDDLKPEDKRP